MPRRSQTLDFKVPIVGWNAPAVEMPLVTQSVSTDATPPYKITSVDVQTACSSSPCALTNPVGISSVSFNSTGSYTVNFSPSFSVHPVCTAIPGGSAQMIAVRNNPSTTSWVVQTFVGGTPTNATLSIICFGDR